MSENLLLPRPGGIVRVRQRQYLVDDVIPAPAASQSTLVRMSCVEDDAQGQPLAVLWEQEPDAEVKTDSGWAHLAKRGFDSPNLFASYLHTLRWNCVTATNPRLFQAPFRAGIKIDAYQIEPLRKALLLPRVNLFIADDVGLGKTIEAGLIARELILRKKVRDIVVACPPSVLPQWQGELAQRFGLEFEILDREYFTKIRRERGYATNPWSTHSRFLISNKLLIDETYAAPLRDWLGDFRAGSILILDEAHHAAPSSGSRYAIDSKITRAIRDIAPRFEHRLFLSATPHNGHSNSFSALLEILDPQRFCRGVPVKGRKLLDDVMVRRIKDDIRELQGGFPKRTVVQIDIDGLPADAPELKLAAMLDRYRDLVEARVRDEPKRKQSLARLLIGGLQQRLLSSVEAFARTLRVHRRSVEKRLESERATPRLFDLVSQSVGSDDERAELEADELAREEETQLATATASVGGARADELKLLDEMLTIAEQACGRPDARIERLFDWIRENQCPKLPKSASDRSGTPATWTDRRVIIFTEWEDTLRYVRQQLEARIADTDLGSERIAVYHGPTPTPERERIKRAFNADPAKNPLRILLCTDAAREGINLQTQCADLFHFDVPWNPSRLEQRNGRIDRKLQPSPEVRCHYFVYLQRPEDRVLKALVAKTKIIRRELGSLSQVIEDRLADTLKDGIRRREIDKLEKTIEQEQLGADTQETVVEELEAARDRQSALKDQIDELRNRLKDSRDWVGIEVEPFRAALSCALNIAGADGLTPDPKDAHRWTFPALDARSGGDPTWADTLDSLRTPRDREQTFWEWRRESQLRPIVFDDPGIMTEDVVHLHLDHPVVRRLLGRFTAQGFVFDDLSRACFAQTDDPIPRVVLLGRLCLYGTGAARLHEEIIAVTARWLEPDKRKGPLSPYGRDAEGNTLQLLEAALKAGKQPKNDVILKRLQANGPRDVEELLPHLIARGNAIATEAKAKLAKRGHDEAARMLEILEAQKKRIETTVGKTQTEQMTLFNDDEMKQLEADRRHWARRLVDLKKELTTEPERIRAVYEVRAERVEPVGLAYLWPVTG